MQYRYETVLQNESIAPGIWKMRTTCIEEPKVGQFYMLRRETHGTSVLLPRPISVANWENNEVEFIYQSKGRGTIELEDLKAGDKVYQMGPQGKGFPIDFQGKIALVGGGVGIAPMIYTARKLSEQNSSFEVFLGFQDIPYATEDFLQYTDHVGISTETGNVGIKGRVTALFNPADFDVVFCCGPNPMMEAVVKLCEESKTPVYISLENKMACAIGTCLLCTCRTKSGKSLRTCIEGPVFRGEEVDFHAGN